MNTNDLVWILTGVLIGAGLVRYGIHVGVKMVYTIKTDKPLDEIATPTEQNDTFEEETESE